MSVKAICELPVARLFQENAHLYLWATNNYLPAALEVMAVWGFRYVSTITWGKVLNGRVQTGLGQYFRGASEHLLFGVRGSLPYRVVDGKRAQGSTLVLAPRGEHSAKPEVFRGIIERVSPGPYVELFARQATPGWAGWGNEVVSSFEMEAQGRVPKESGLTYFDDDEDRDPRRGGE